jgi:amino acid adenylation domain-containing protein
MTTDDDRDALLRLLLADEGLDAAPASIPPRPAGAAPVLSYAQERMWFLSRFEPEGSALNIRLAVRVRGELDLDALRRAVAAIVARHDVLRTTIVDEAGDPRPVVHDAPALPFEVVDLGAEPEALDTRLAADGGRPFDLAVELPIRVMVYRIGPGDHVVTIVMHHIASDGWSIRVLSNELDTLYTAFAAGGSSPLPPLPVQYADYAHWQRTAQDDERMRRQVAYWKEQLAPPLPTFEIPPDFVRPKRHSVAGAATVRHLDAELASRLRGVAHRSGATLFMVLAAAFDVVAARHAGEDDVVIGIPVAGRVRPELEPLIGAFLNNLVLRTDLSGDPTFIEVVDRVRTASLAAFDHQDVPFERLLAELQPQRDLARTPLFQVFFNMLELASMASPVTSMGGLEHELLAEPEPDAKFDLTMYVDADDQGITLRCVYNRQLYDAGTMEEFVDQYAQLLGAVVDDPDLPISRYSLQTARGRAIAPDAAAPLDATWHGSVHGAVRRHAGERPDAVAVEDRRGRWTYRELAAGVGELSAWLRMHHIRHGDVVAIHGHRSATLVWAVLGVLASGATYVVLDPAYPPARLARYLRIAKPRGWVGLAEAGEPPPEVAELLDDLGVTARITLPPSGAPPTLGGASAAPAMADTVEPGADDPACLTFTSGSTGTPKAVVGRHGSLTHFFPWMSERFEVGGDDRFSMLSGLAHDPLQRDMFWPLWLGATVVIPDPDQLGEPGWIAGWMARERITVAHLTPATGQLIAEGAGSSSSAPAAPLALRRAFFIGDVLTRVDVERLRGLAPSAQVVNLYGTTETQRASGYHVVDHTDMSDVPRRREVLPLGVGMPGVQLHVRTAAGSPAGIGEIGEIVFRSPHLALGYLGDPEGTARRFEHPADSPGERTYRTGDRGRLRLDGQVEFMGRGDHQVQVRGFRIELGEVEAALRRFDDVAQAVVRREQATADAARLVGYVVLRPGASTDGRQLVRRLRAELPVHMVPAEIHRLDALPLTPNGKLDAGRLPSGPAVHPAGEEPNDELERLLVDLWREVLGRDDIGVHDDFFELGGFSLLATRLFARVEERTGTRLPLSTLFESPTVASLAEAMRTGGWKSQFTSLVAVQPKGSAPPLFYVAPYTISVLQFSYLAGELGPDQPVYGFEPQGLDGRLPAHETVEEMAAHYIAEMKVIQPTGPYTLAGHCSGAWVAFEMVRQLEAAGETLRTVIVVDRGPPGVRIPIRHPFRSALKRAAYYFRDGRLWHSLAWKVRMGLMRLRTVRQLQSPLVRRAEQVRDQHRAALGAYRGGRISHGLVLVRSDEWIQLHDAEWYDRWADVTDGEIRTVSVPGTHATMLNPPFVAELARQLRQFLPAPQPQG